jgi:hypothetical protein
MKIGLARVSPVPQASMAERPEQPEALLYRKLVKPPSKHIPVWIDHDESRVVGRVRELSRSDEPMLGWWHIALVELHDPPEWANASTPVSLSTKPLYMSASTAYGRELAHEALVVELSLVSPSQRPAEPLARMLTLHEAVDPWDAPPPTLDELGPLTEENALAHWDARIELGEDPSAAYLDIERKLAKQKGDPRLGRRPSHTGTLGRQQVLRRNCGQIIGIR